MSIGRRGHHALDNKGQNSCKWLVSACAAAVAALAMVRPCSASVVTYQEDSQPSASFQGIATYLRSDKATSNFGREPRLSVGTLGGSTGRFRGVFAYDLRATNALLAGSTITDVSFALTVSDTDGSSVSRGVMLELHSLTGTITEGSGSTLTPSTNDVTWNNRTTGAAWTAAGGDISPTILASLTADPTAVQGGTVLTFSGSGRVKRARPGRPGGAG